MSSTTSKPRTFGKTGLRISPLALGTGSFGDKWGEGWSIPREDSEKIFNAFLDSGQNHIDTADFYQGGDSETLVGEFLQKRGGRESVVLSSKFTMSMDPKNPNGGGNGRKHMLDAVEKSLQRLQTHYLDVLYAHHWDTITPPEELLRTFDDLVRCGKVRHVALSNFPGWYLGEAGALSAAQGWEKVCGIQMEYNLLERSIEDEFIPYAKHSGVGVLAWSPLANGLLSGKYTIDREKKEITGAGRITSSWVTDPGIDPFAEATQHTLDALEQIAGEVGYSQAQTALAWVLHQPAITGVIIGASKLTHVESSIEALDIKFTQDQLRRLNDVSQRKLKNPYSMHLGGVQENIHGENGIALYPHYSMH